MRELVLLNGADRCKVLRTLLAIEHRASHPMAPALAEYSRRQLGTVLADEAIKETAAMQLEVHA